MNERCLGGEACGIATGDVLLMDGAKVCNACPEWRDECEARRLQSYPVVQRMEALRERDKIRPSKAMEKLRALMEKVHADQRAKRAEAKRILSGD